MHRITTDQPSSGKPLLLYVPADVNGGFVNTSATELCEAPTFSVPATFQPGAVQDGSDPDREVRAGEIFFDSPMIASNYTDTTRWVQLEVVLATFGKAYEGGHLITSGQGGGASGSIYMTPRLSNDARLYDIATSAMITPKGDFSSDAFWGSVQLSDGRIYLIPVTGTARIYNPVTNTYTTPVGTFPNNSHRCGVRLDDGKIFLPPWAGDQARIYDPTANTLAVAGGSYTFPAAVVGKYLSAVKLADGKVFMAPFGATNGAVYDPAANTITPASGTFPSASSSISALFSSCVLLNDGKVFCAPYTSAAVRAAIYNPTTNTLALVSTNYPSTTDFGYFGSIKLSNGNVYIVGHQSATSLIYNPTTDTTTVAGGTLPGDSAYRVPVLMLDEKVFLVPYNALEARIYDPVANTVTVAAGDYPGCAESVLLTQRLPVSAKSTRSIAIQGQRLLAPAQGDSESIIGGRLIAKAEVGDAIKVFCSATELEAIDHAPST
jgi:hypothetical protein